MAVRIGSARINEKGTTTGGKAGDQTGGEVSIQNYYLHRKGWYVASRSGIPYYRNRFLISDSACSTQEQ